MTSPEFHLFEVFGVELEYMIVDADSLDVRPLADRLLQTGRGKYLSEIERGELAWSNELALHVVELKTNGPADSLSRLDSPFQDQIAQINRRLEKHQARLMPTAMHPWMDPHTEFSIWPHEYNEIYENYHRIFDCRGHGWANLQSVHLNLPFADDQEFGRLHAAIRLILPLLPALAASSPFADGMLSPWLDTRMEYYRHNSRKIASITADVVPEPVYSRQAYEQQILQKMYREIRPFDPQGILQHEWLNARGAIARFDRNAIEIRVLDIQECPQADLAICKLIVETLRLLVDERFTSLEEQQAVPGDCLSQLLVRSIATAENTIVSDRRVLRQFGLDGARCTATELWQGIVREIPEHRLDPATQATLHTILDRGTLATRIVSAWQPWQTQPDTSLDDRSSLEAIYRHLCDCLDKGQLYIPSEI